MHNDFWRILLRSGALLLASLLLVSCGQDGNPNGTTGSGSKKSPTEITDGDGSGNLSQVDLARRRVALRSIIRKGDYYHARNEASTAIAYYEKAYGQIQQDSQVALRLANAYLELKNFTKAADIFAKFDLSNFDEASKRKVISSIMLDENRTNKKEMIAWLGLTDGTKAYLNLIDDCTNKPGDCIKLIQESNSPDYQIQALRETMQSAKGTSEDELYIRTLLIGKLFEQKSYLAVKKIGMEILQLRPNYKVVLKIVGYSDYELGDYAGAAKVLEQYYSIEPKDVEVAYMLGIVNYFKEDYSTSNLYFNSAVLNGYTPKTELERRLVYNYVLLGDTVGAFKIFRFLLDENDAMAEDYQIALFTAEQAGEYSKVALWSRKGLNKFPQDAVLHAYVGAAATRSQDYAEAEQYLLRARELDSKQPIVLLELGRLYFQKGEYQVAREYLTDTIGNDQGGYFATEAEKFLSTFPANATASGASETGITASGTSEIPQP